MSLEIRKLDQGVFDYSSQVARLYAFEGWIRPDEDINRVGLAIANSYCAFGAFEDGLMIGFFRALSDGVCDAYLLDLVVDPAYRKKGVGSMLTKAVLDELARENITWTTCIANPGADKLYEKFGKQMRGFIPFAFSDEKF